RVHADGQRLHEAHPTRTRQDDRGGGGVEVGPPLCRPDPRTGAALEGLFGVRTPQLTPARGAKSCGGGVGSGKVLPMGGGYRRIRSGLGWRGRLAAERCSERWGLAL